MVASPPSKLQVLIQVNALNQLNYKNFSCKFLKAMILFRSSQLGAPLTPLATFLLAARNGQIF